MKDTNLGIWAQQVPIFILLLTHYNRIGNDTMAGGKYIEKPFKNTQKFDLKAK